jgi:hypothetical protein
MTQLTPGPPAQEKAMTLAVVLVSVSALTTWAVHDLQAFAEQFVTRKHAND